MKGFTLPAILVMVIVLGSSLLAAERLRLGSAVKVFPPHYLAILASQEKGFFQRAGLDVEWIPLAASPVLNQALAAGSVDLGITPGISVVQGAGRGLLLVVVGELTGKIPALLWVKSDSRFRQPSDLKGAKIAVTRLGDMPHAHGRLLAKALGIEKDIRFVAAGGLAEALAAFRTGLVDVLIQSAFTMINLKIKGEARELVSMQDYLPADWVDHVIYGQKEFVASNTSLTQRVVKALLEGAAFALANRPWGTEKMKALSGYSDEAARAVYPHLTFSQDGKVSRRGLENLRGFLIEYGIISKERTPPVDQLYLPQFAR